MISKKANTTNLARLKTQIAKARQKLNRAWETYQMTDADVLVAAAELDRLCNEYERVKKSSGQEQGNRSQEMEMTVDSGM